MHQLSHICYANMRQLMHDIIKKAPNPCKWYATRQVDKLNNENFSFPVLYVPGFFMLHFEVSLCDTPLVSGYLSFAEPVC